MAVLQASALRQRRHHAGVDVMISWLTADGEEREERWPSVERFRAWAAAEGLRCSWRAYVQDEDGEWELVDEGVV